MTKKKTNSEIKSYPQLDETSDMLASFALVKGGHEDGRICLIVGVTLNGDVLIADGKRRKIECPKLKSSCHVRVLESSEEALSLMSSGKLSNRMIRRILFHRRDYSAKG